MQHKKVQYLYQRSLKTLYNEIEKPILYIILDYSLLNMQLMHFKFALDFHDHKGHAVNT